jgi:hypothetical protein
MRKKMEKRRYRSGNFSFLCNFFDSCMAGRGESSSSSTLHAARSALSAIARLDQGHEVLLPLAPGVLAWGCVAKPTLVRFKTDDWLAVSAADSLIAADAEAAVRREEASLDAAAAAEATEAAAQARNAAARAALAAALGGGKVLSDVTHSDGARVRIVEEDGMAVSYITEPFDAGERRGGGERAPPAAAAAKTAAPPRARLSDAEFAMILARLEGGAAKEAAAEARPPGARATPTLVGKMGVREATAAASPTQPPAAAATVEGAAAAAAASCATISTAALVPGPLGDVRERLPPAETPQDAAAGSAAARAPEATPRMSRFLAARRGLL